MSAPYLQYQTIGGEKTSQRPHCLLNQECLDPTASSAPRPKHSSPNQPQPNLFTHIWLTVFPQKLGNF